MGVRRELNLKYQQKILADSGISVQDSNSSGPETCSLSPSDHNSINMSRLSHQYIHDGEIHLSDDTDGSFNELQIDEDDSLIDISINTEFEQNDILNDLKAKINANLSENQKRNIKQTNEQRMNDIISEKLKKLSIRRKTSNDSSIESENYGSEPHSSSGYD